MSLFQPNTSGVIKSELLISSGASPFFKEKRCCPLPMMGWVRPRVAELPGSCSWIALLQLCTMMLGRTSAFFIYLGFKILLCTGRIQDLTNLSKQPNVNVSLYQVCSTAVNDANSAAPQHIPLPADCHRSRTNATRSCSLSHHPLPCCQHALSPLTPAGKEQLGQGANTVLRASLSACLTPERVYLSASLSSLKALYKSGRHDAIVSLAKPSQHLTSLSFTLLYPCI